MFFQKLKLLRAELNITSKTLEESCNNNCFNFSALKSRMSKLCDIVREACVPKLIKYSTHILTVRKERSLDEYE